MVAQKPRDNKKAPAKKQQKPRETGLHPADLQVNETKKFKGTVVYYNKEGGFGFIKPDQSGLVPEDKVMVHWKAIQSHDTWAFLHKEMAVQFKLAKLMKRDGSGCYLKAVEVTAADGKKIALQDDIDDKREFIHSKATRFTGAVKFYDVTKGFGYVTMEDGYAGVDDVPKELRVVRSNIRSPTDEAPILAPGVKVEFGISKNLKGNYACYNLTLPGGDLVSRNVVENRKAAGHKTFDGQVQWFDFKKGYGYITPSADARKGFPQDVTKELNASVEKTQKRLAKAGKDKKASNTESLLFFRTGDIANRDGPIRHGLKASYKVYTDNKGAGACDVKIVA